MYCLKVELTERKMSELVPTEDNDYMEVFKEPLDQECVEFSVGNPRVEHITGLVHLYKRNTAPYGSHEPWKASTGPSEADVSQTLCCLAIPADMSVANFCTFIGAYLGEVRSMQVLRREGSQPSVCMVLLTFATQDQADSFYADFNSTPFSSLEPDILCRLVYVRTVEVLSSRGRPAPVSLPAAAKAITATAAATAAADTPAEAAAGAGQSASTPSSTTADSKTYTDDGATKAGTAAAAAAAADGSSTTSKQAASKQLPESSKPHSSSSSSTHQQQQQQHNSSTASSYAAALFGQAGTSATDSAAKTAAAAAGGASAAAAAGGGSSAAADQWLEPPPGTTELPTCPVCLERLDEHISGIVTTVCNHRFHGACIKHWGDTSCPVCRYCMLSSNASTSRCSTCGTNTNLWICLICGHVGCGRYKAGHAYDHWKASAHCYALELETQRVWDYAGDGYVHRLIQSKTDGKLVEVPSPAPTCPHGSPSLHHHHRRNHHHHRQRSTGDMRADALCRSRSGSSAAGAGAGACSSGNEADMDACTSGSCPVCADESKQLKEALVCSKLEAISLEYNHLLATQLDSQRQYFEGLLVQQDAKQQAAVAAMKASAQQAQAASEAAAASAKESERRRQQLEHKLSDLNSSLSKVTEEREFLRSLNETLLSNQKEFNSKLSAAQAELAAKDAQLQDLQEQVRDLMVYIEAQRTIQSAGGSELQEATLLPMPQSRSSNSSTRSSRRSSKK